MGRPNVLIVQVDLFAGTDIGDAAFALCELANKVDELVETKFNDVTLWARPRDNPYDLVKAYEKVVTSPYTFKIAQAKDVQ